MKICSERHSRGQILPMTALLLTVLVGFMGLAVDAGYFFDYKRRMTTAADSAAVAGAWAVRRGDGANVVTVARNAAAENGFPHGTDDITVTVNHPPTSGYGTGNNDSVEVVIDRPHPTFFIRALGVMTTTVAARAVAGLGEEKGCIYVLDPRADRAFLVNGGAVLNTPSCSIYVNSSNPSTAMYLAGSGACVLSDSINIAGGNGGGGCITPTPNTNVPPTPDPFATRQAPTVGSCDHPSNVTVNSGVVTLNPGTYCGGITISSAPIVTFNPGLYILKDTSKKTPSLVFSITGQAITSGSGVTFYIDSGSVQITGGSSTQLSAPTSGQWEGILFFQNRSNTQQVIFSGGSAMSLKGTLYFPKAPMQYSGGNVTTAYTILVSKTLQVAGTSLFNADYASLANGDPIKKPMLSE